MARILAGQQTREQGLLAEFTEALQRGSLEIEPDCDREVPFKAFDGPLRLDAQLRIAGERPAIIAVEIMITGYPRDMRNAVWVLQEYARSKQGEEVLLAVLAERLSPGARELLRARGIAFYDRSGSMFFKRGDLVIDIERPFQPVDRARPGTEFYGAREQVVHALLHLRGKSFTGTELARLANTSPYTVSQTLQILEDKGQIAGQSAGRAAKRRLSDPGALLDAWAAAWKGRPEYETHWFYFARNPATLATSLGWELVKKQNFHDWAYSGTEAGNFLAPLLTGVDRLHLVVPRGRTGKIAEAAQLKEAESGWNVRVTEREGAGLMFTRVIDEFDIPIASPFIVYLDLLKDDRGRNKELAQNLREQVLKI